MTTSGVERPIAPSQTPIPLRISTSVASGTALLPLNSTMVAIALVHIGDHFSAPSAVAWLVPALYTATAVAAPLAGRLGTLFGARRMYLAGLALVGAAAGIGTLAPTVAWLIVSYILLGVGVAAHYPSAMTILRQYANEHRSETRTGIMVLAMFGQSVAALGPSIGGLLVGTFGWQSIMWVNLPVVVVSAATMFRFAPSTPGTASDLSRRDKIKSLDILGAILLLVASSATMLVLLTLPTAPLWWLIPVSVLSFGAFVVHERRVSSPLFDVGLFARNRALSATLVCAMLAYIAFYCTYFALPQWLQHVRDLSPVATGLMVLPFSVAALLSMVVATWMYHRCGALRTLAVGTMVLFAGAVLMAALDRSTAPLVVLAMASAVLGIPNGLVNIGNQNILNSVTTVEEIGMATGMYRTVQLIGASLAVVVLQMAGGPTMTDQGLERTSWVMAGIGAVLSVSIGVAALRGRRVRP